MSSCHPQGPNPVDLGTSPPRKYNPITRSGLSRSGAGASRRGVLSASAAALITSKGYNMKSLIQFMEGRTFLEDSAWDIAMATLDGDSEFAAQLLGQIDNEIDRAYCRGVASALQASMTGIVAFDGGIDVPEEAPLTLH